MADNNNKQANQPLLQSQAYPPQPYPSYPPSSYPPSSYPPSSYPPSSYPPGSYSPYQQQQQVYYPNNVAISVHTCSFHPQFAAVNKCYGCGKMLCLECTHDVRTSRWITRDFCHDCAGRARTTRLIFFVISLVIFLIVFGIMMAMFTSAM